MLALILKEFRTQSRSKKLYLIQAFSLIFLSFSTIFLSSLHTPSQDYYAPNVSSFLIFCFLMALIIYAIVPVLAVEGIALEREENTFQLLASTSTSHLWILFGKLCYISTFIVTSLLIWLPIGRLLALFSGAKLSDILDCYLVILISAITFVYISLAISLFCHRAQAAIWFSYLILAFFCAGSIVCASLFGVFSLRLFSPFFAILNVMRDVNGYPLGGSPKIPKFLVILAIYAPIWAVVTVIIKAKGRGRKAKFKD